MKTPTLAEAAQTLAAILSTIVKMSDDVKTAASPLDMQGKLLRMQNSIQKNALLVVPHIVAVQDALKAERGSSNEHE